MQDEKEKLDEAYRKFHRLHERSRGLVLATVGVDSMPRASATPFVRGDSGSFYVYVSRLSEHTTNLLSTPVTSILLMEDEAETKQMFARTRISYLCDAESIEPDDADYRKLLEVFTERYGDVVDLLGSLPDFILFELKPRSGRFVMGFGRAYDLIGGQLDKLIHVGADQPGRPNGEPG